MASSESMEVALDLDKESCNLLFDEKEPICFCNGVDCKATLLLIEKKIEKALKVRNDSLRCIKWRARCYHVHLEHKKLQKQLDEINRQLEIRNNFQMQQFDETPEVSIQPAIHMRVPSRGMFGRGRGLITKRVNPGDEFYTYYLETIKVQGNNILT